MTYFSWLSTLQQNANQNYALLSQQKGGKFVQTNCWDFHCDNLYTVCMKELYGELLTLKT